MQREIMTSIPFLEQPSRDAQNTDEDFAVAQDIKDTLDAHRNSCVGMAANMIGVSKRIIAFVDEDFGGRIFIMFNPEITARDGAFDTSEGCLSLQRERHTVRHQRIEVTYFDRKFRERHAAFTGFTAHRARSHRRQSSVRPARLTTTPTYDLDHRRPAQTTRYPR